MCSWTRLQWMAWCLVDATIFSEPVSAFCMRFESSLLWRHMSFMAYEITGHSFNSLFQNQLSLLAIWSFEIIYKGPHKGPVLAKTFPWYHSTVGICSHLYVQNWMIYDAMKYLGFRVFFLFCFFSFFCNIDVVARHLERNETNGNNNDNNKYM